MSTERTMKPTKIFSASDKYQAEMILGLLKNNGIPCYRKAPGSGDYMDVYAGNSLNGENIFVDETDAARARQLIADTLGRQDFSDPEFIDHASEEELNKMVGSKRRFSNSQRIFAIITILVLVISLLYNVISSML